MEKPPAAHGVPGHPYPSGPNRSLRWALFGIFLLLPVQGLAASEPAVRMEVRHVVVDPTHRTPVVILTGAGRVLPIWIGAAEARAISRALEGVPLSRPDTHDLIGNLLDGLDAEPERVTITEIRDNTYFAVITVKAGDRAITVDSRPSDAIAVALRTGTPIYATTEVLERAVKLEEREFPARDGVTRLLGMHLQDLTEELARLFDTRRHEGVLVAHVERDGAASRLGFRRGDVITGVDRENVRNTRELKRILHSGSGTRPRMLHIQRDGEPVTIVVDPPSREKR